MIRALLDRRKLALGLALAAAAGLSWWLARTGSAPAPAVDSRARHEPDYVIENFVARVMNERGTLRYRLTAHKLVHYADDDSSELEQPYLVQFSEAADAPSLARGPADVQDARMPRRPGMAESGLGPIGEAADAPSLARGPRLGPIGEAAAVHIRAQRGWMPADRKLIDMRGDVRVARGRDPKSAGGEMTAQVMRIRLDD